MTFPNLATSVRGLRGAPQVLVVALLLALSAIFAWLAIAQSSQQHISSWYPAAGINVVAAIAVRRRYRPLILAFVVLITFGAQFSAGRPLLVCIVGSLAVAAEAWIVTLFAVDRDDQPRLTSGVDVVRFFVGILLGSVLLGVVAGAAVFVTSGGNYASLIFSVMASHGSAMIVIAPIALVNRMKRPMGRRWVQIVHAALLLASVLVAFAPTTSAPLAFLPIPFLAWAAFSFSMSVSLTELIAVSGIVVLLSSFGRGPFQDGTSSTLSPTSLIELYVITLSVTTLLIAAARNERQILEEQKGATAQLLHLNFEQSPNGFMIVREDEGHFRVLEVNPAAIALMPLSVTPEGSLIPHSPVVTVLKAMLVGTDKTITHVNDNDASNIPAILTVTAVTNSTFGQILLLSVIDLRAQRAAALKAAVQLEREQLVVEELQTLNRQKDDFVSSVTHELRTPITAIIGFAEELDETKLDDEQANYVSIIRRNAGRLLTVIEDVLTFSRRRPGMTETTGQVEVDVNEAITLVLDDLRHSIQARDLTVTTDLHDEPVFVLAEPNALTRVFVNILTNSVKFSPFGGSMTVTASVRETDVEITIVDTGPGIEAADLNHVFDRFYRASRAAHDGVPGTGLGLSIVRELVEDMSGTVVLESDGTTGTTARITLPLARAATAD